MDDFSQFENPEADWTDPLTVSFGAIQVAEFRVPYMTSVLKFRQVHDYLNLVTDDPKYAEQDWSVEELYQREVNHARVIDMADNYLNPDKADRPAFFNSITVVLSLKKMNEKDYAPPSPDERCKESLTVGPVCVSFNSKAEDASYPRPGSVGLLRWNMNQVHAVAIDGQHRLAALQHLWKHHKTEDAKNSDISIIFLLVDESLGFTAAKSDKFDSVSLMRSIFIDLNKHAVKVARSREILLDDMDPIARFVKELIGRRLLYRPTDQVTSAGFKIGECGEFAKRLPLELVDWHSETKSKVDTGPYITSIIGLEWIVKQALKSRLSPLKEINISNYDFDESAYYGLVKKNLEKWKRSWEAGIADAVDEAEAENSPFILSKAHVDSIAEEFSYSWGKPITRLLTQLTPYRLLAERRVKSETLTPQFGQWFQAKAAFDSYRDKKKSVSEEYETRFNSVKSRLKKDGYDLAKFAGYVKDIEDEIKKNSIFFLVVGQRALINSLFDISTAFSPLDLTEIADVKLNDFPDCDAESDYEPDLYAYYLVRGINRLFENGGSEVFRSDMTVKRSPNGDTEQLSRAFWAGSLVRQQGDIDFSDAAAKRGSKWIVLIAHLSWLFEKCDEAKFKSVLKAVDDPAELDDYGRLGQLVKKWLGRVIGDVDYHRDYPMSFLASILDEENPTVLDKVARTATKERLKALQPFIDP